MSRRRDDYYQSERRRHESRYESRHYYDYDERDHKRYRDQRYQRERSPIRRSYKEEREPQRLREPHRRERRNSSPEREKLADLPISEQIKKLDFTVGIHNLSLKTRSHTLINLFESHGLRVKDAKIVRDARTNVSKGIAYVEFAELSQVDDALKLSGVKCDGNELRITTTEMERVLLGNQLKNGALVKSKDVEKERDMKMRRIRVSYDEDYSKDDLREIFSEFGKVDSIVYDADFNRDYNDGEGGDVVIQFSLPSAAKNAFESVKYLPGIRSITWAHVSPGDGSNSKRRAELMQKLQQQDE